jgi:hypothetical protein
MWRLFAVKCMDLLRQRDPSVEALPFHEYLPKTAAFFLKYVEELLHAYRDKTAAVNPPAGVDKKIVIYEKFVKFYFNFVSKLVESSAPGVIKYKPEAVESVVHVCVTVLALKLNVTSSIKQNDLELLATFFEKEHVTASGAVAVVAKAFKDSDQFRRLYLEAIIMARKAGSGDGEPFQNDERLASGSVMMSAAFVQLCVDVLAKLVGRDSNDEVRMLAQSETHFSAVLAVAAKGTVSQAYFVLHENLYEVQNF